MDWNEALSTARLRPQSTPVSPGDEGNEFLSDYYRVVFSSPFRRLQDKTQVTPLAKTDFVRRRLTHSLEVATIGERMGRVVAAELGARLGPNVEKQKEVVGKIVANACLLHDIGNPPFGHEGEVAIREWADDVGAPDDYRCFDGNAQGFRIACRLHHHGKDHGMNLTVATLGAMLKYPRGSVLVSSSKPKKRGSFSIFASEEGIYRQVCEKSGVTEGVRHPLSFLMEAADDIVNRLVDLEDGIKVGLVALDQLQEVFRGDPDFKVRELWTVLEERRSELSGRYDDIEQLAFQHLRAHET